MAARSTRLTLPAWAVFVFGSAPLSFAGTSAATPPELTEFFRPPAEFAGQFGGYASPLRFYDGRPVRDRADWALRRKEILVRWHGLLGPWPPLIDCPAVEWLESEKREIFVQHRVRLEIAPRRFAPAILLEPEGPGPFPAVLVPYYDPETSVGQSKVPLRDFALQLVRRGFICLAIGAPGGVARQPDLGGAQCQPLSFLAYVAANCANALAGLPRVDSRRIGVAGHSYGGKWALFASCLSERFACAVWSDPGVVFDETNASANYWEPWYLGRDAARTRPAGLVTPENPRTGAYARLVAQNLDLHELHALMAPRPFLVSGGAVDPPARWLALNHAVAVNTLLGHSGRVAMTHRPAHPPTAESNEQIYRFLEYFLREASR